MAPPDRESLFAESLATIAALSRGVQRIRMKKPGNTNAVDPARLCLVLSPPESLDFHERKPDLFENGVGKSYEGHRIAFVEGEGFCRMENDGSERPAAPCEIFRFKADLADAARSDECLRRYIGRAGVDRA